MKLAFVTPRYGLEVIGGAELGARLLSEQLVARLGWQVEVFTTRALDAVTWADELPAGQVEINGVIVNRFASESGRHPDFDQLSSGVLHKERPTRAEQLEWINWQGPVCPAAIDAAHASHADLVAFYPYLFYPTVHGVPRLGVRAVLHPAAHDELPIRLPIFREVFEGARGIWYQTEGERRLVERLFPATVTTHQTVLGLGVDTGSGDPDVARATVGGPLAAGRPYLLCLGRVDRGKGSDVLARYFGEYKRRRPGPLALVFAGPVVHDPPDHPDIVMAGAVDDATKWGLLRGARVLVSPSAWESFSLVLIEAWSVGTPALVNARCDATRGQCKTSGGGLWFDSYPLFEAAVDRLVDDAPFARRLGAAGSAFVEERYRWPRIVEGYSQFCERMLAPPARRNAAYARPNAKAAVVSDADESANELGRRIADLVAARREAGEYPDDLEAQMDEHFRRVAGLPGGPAVGDMLAATRALRERPGFRVPAPTASQKLGGAAMHRAVGVAIRGHMSELVDQLNEFAEAVRNAVTAMADTISVSGPRHVHGQLEAMDARLAEMQRTLNRLADAAVSDTDDAEAEK